MFQREGNVVDYTGYVRSNELMPTLGEIIRKERLSRGLTQGQFAELMDVEDQTVSNWEQDYTRPKLSMVGKLAGEIRLSAAKVMELMQSEPPVDDKLRKIILKNQSKLREIATSRGVAPWKLAQQIFADFYASERRRTEPKQKQA